MIQEQVIPIDFGQGVDTKTDPKSVVAGKFLRLENGLFTNPKRIGKRNGYTLIPATIAGGGSFSSPLMAHGYNDELLIADSGSLYSYSPSGSASVLRGKYVSTELTRSSIDQVNPSSGYVDSAVLGNYILYVWSTAASQSVDFPVYSKTYASIVDIQSGVTIVGPTLLSTASSTFVNTPLAMCLGGTVLAVAYINAAGTAVVSRVASFSGGTASFGGEQTITTGFVLGGFDTTATTAGGVIVYENATGMAVSTISTAGAVVTTATIADANVWEFCFHISQNSSNGNLWVYWTNVTLGGGGVPTASSVVYAVYTSSLVSVLGKTTAVTSATPYYITNIFSITTSATQQVLFHGYYEATNLASNRYTDTSGRVTLTSAGGISAGFPFANGVMPYSKPITISSNNYAVFVYRAADLIVNGGVFSPKSQPTYFLVSLALGLDIPNVVARFGYGLAGNQKNLQAMPAHLSTISALSASKIQLACGIEIQELGETSFAYAIGYTGGLSGAFSYSIDFSGANTYDAINCGELAVLNGALVQVYDGSATSEFGFHLAPEISEADPLNSVAPAGAIGAGSYSYIAIYQWTDAQGNLHQSAPSLPFAATIAGMDNSVQISVSTSYLSQKSGASIALFRTTNAGTIYYQVTDPVFVQSASSISVTAISFLDIYADADIEGNPQAYTYPASSVLENTTPPPSTILLSHNNRLWFVDSENPNTEWYTKSFQDGVGLGPSAFLTQTLDPKFGNISGLAEMDEKLVSAKESGFFVQSGDGANDTGTGNTLSFPQMIPSDVGISEMKSIVGMPKGVMFKSQNGIYLLSRSLEVMYIGAEVESYNSQTIVSADIIKGKSQIRFLCSTGLTLVYDYIFNQWSTFSNHTGVSATDWNGTYVYVRTNGVIYKEAAGTYTDNGTGFSLGPIQTSWLALASIQGFQRVKRLIMLGDFVNGLSSSHALSIQAAYDFSTTFQSAVSYAFGAASASGVFQYRERLPIQKCDSISLLIQETTTGSSLEYIDLTNISFEAAVKKGVNKLGGSYSVG